MKVELLEIDQVKPYFRNPRNNKKSIARVQRSLKRFGFRQAIVVDKDFVVIAGHTRLQAARNLGIKKVPVHVAGDMSERDAKAYRLVDNRSGEESEWDDDLLVKEIDDIAGSDRAWSLEELGFETYTFRLDEDKDDTKEKKKKPKREAAYKTIFEVVVECTSEKDQKALYEHLTGKGHKCRVLSM